MSSSVAKSMELIKLIISRLKNVKRRLNRFIRNHIRGYWGLMSGLRSKGRNASSSWNLKNLDKGQKLTTNPEEGRREEKSPDPRPAVTHL